MAEAIERIRIIGLVQGVFYRKWAQRTGRSLGLRGFVRNMADGSVEAVVAGPPDRVDLFARACRAGPQRAEVEEVRRSPAAAGDLPEGDDLVIAEDA